MQKKKKAFWLVDSDISDPAIYDGYVCLPYVNIH